MELVHGLLDLSQLLDPENAEGRTETRNLIKEADELWRQLARAGQLSDVERGLVEDFRTAPKVLR